MRKALKALGVLLLVVVIAVAAGALYVERTDIPHYPTQKIELKIEVTPERVEHGRKIAGLLCAGCHLDPPTDRLTGRLMPDVPPQFGVAYSRNITQDPRHGIGSWTDGEIAYLLRTGIARDGRYTPPWMTKLPHAADEDIASIIAFLRSDDPQVRASSVENRESRPAFLTKLLSRVAWKPFPYPTEKIGRPDGSDRIARGKYLAVALLDCYSCHSVDFATNDYLRPERSKGFFGGGNQMLDANQVPIRTANITFDEETGIGRWSEDQFVRALKGGFRPDNTPLLYPMEPMIELADEDVRAIYAYLRTVPPLHNAVPRRPRTAVAADAPDGKRIYYKYSCQSCHGDGGVGLCDLRNNLDLYENDADLIAFIHDPAATHEGSKMPAWKGVIAEAEYAPLVRYLRTLGGKAARDHGVPPAVKVEGVVFDIDGTLVDNIPFHMAAFDTFCGRHGLPPLDEEKRAAIDGKRNRDVFPIVFGRPLSDDEVERYSSEKEHLYRELSRGKLTPRRGLLPLLARLEARSLPQALATSAPAANVGHTLHELALTARLPHIVRSDEVGRGKPFPDVFLAAARLIRSDPARTVAFEDAPAGIVAARAAGMTCIAVGSTHSAEMLAAHGAAPHHIVRDFQEYLDGPGAWLQ